jgi:hypothetical protein
MHNNIIIYYLLFNKYFNIIKRKIKNLLFDFYEVKIIFGEQQKSIFLKFLIISIFFKFTQFLDNIKIYIESIINKYDIDFEKIQITKVLPNKDKRIILEHNPDKKLCLVDIFKKIYCSNQTEEMMNSFHLKFELRKFRGKKISLKNYYIKYRDTDKEFNNSLKNILLFNNIEYNSEDEIYIKKFEKGQLVENIYKLNEIENMHINSF